jgi:hypothetical protein
MATHLWFIPSLIPADPADITNNEWNPFREVVNNMNNRLQAALTTMNPTYVHPDLPLEVCDDPNTTPLRMVAAMHVAHHLHHLNNHCVIEVAIFATLQAQVNAAALAGPALAAAQPAYIKVVMPTQFMGKAADALNYITNCNNYFTMNLLTDD